VVAGKVKRYDNIILFLAKSQDNSTEIAQKVTNFSLAPNKNKVLIWGEKTIIYDLKNHKIINTISLSNIKFSEWSPDSKKILLYGGKDYYVYDLAVNKASRIKLTDKSNIKKIAWHNGDSNKLFLLRKVNLYLIDLAKTTTLLASNISNLAVAENGLIYLAKIDHQYFLEKSDFNLKNNQRIINLKTDNYQIFAQDSDYFLKNSDGTFYLVSGNKLKKINSQVSLIVFSNDEGFWGFGKKTKILYKTALDEIWSYDPKEQTNDLIFLYSKSIQKIAWFSYLSHVLFLTENKIKVVELDGTNEITIAHGLNFDLVNEKELIYLDLNKTVKIIEIRK